MISEKDYEVLYYITPKKYRGVLDGEEDPNEMINFRKERELGEKLIQCSKTDFIETIVKIFKNKYAKAKAIRPRLIDYDLSTKEETLLRKDLKKIVFEFKEGVENIFEGDDVYLDNLSIEFTTPVSGLNNTVKSALQGKQFTEATNNGKTILEVDNSPILKIEVTPTTFQMFIDKNSFIDYGTH
jgi:hypothetical protein